MTATAIPTQSLTVRFAFAIELVLWGLALSVPRSREVLPVAPLAFRIWNRLKRLVARFSALVAAVEAGRVPDRCTRVAEREPRPSLPESRAKAQSISVKLPKGYGWLLALAPELNTRIGRAQIETLLADPALLALLAEAPQAGRILRPLCHGLRIALPDCLRLPARPRRPRRPGAAARDPKPARPPRPPKPSWLRWPKSPPLPGMERRRGSPPRCRARAGPPED